LTGACLATGPFAGAWLIIGPFVGAWASDGAAARNHASNSRFARTTETCLSGLAAIARAATRRQIRSADEVLCAAYLLDRGQVSRFSALLAELQAANPELRLTCTGPWPPYSFAEP